MPNSTTKPGSYQMQYIILGCIIAGFVIFAVVRYWPASADTPQPSKLQIIVSGDTAGWLVPCGCTANQSGGLLRRGVYVRLAAALADVIVLDVGGAPGGTSA